MSTASNTPPPPPAEKAEEPVSQEKQGFREHWPAWSKQLPRFTDFPSMDPKFALIDADKLKKFYEENHVPTDIRTRIDEDLADMDYELLRLFRERDYEAAYHQNRYRLFQLGYIMLATLATLIGSLLALSLNANPDVVPILSLLETLVAIATTFLATISGRESPLPLWMENRRKAEMLRREYYRYIMRLDPYDNIEQVHIRKMLLSERAARINGGNFPEQAGG